MLTKINHYVIALKYKLNKLFISKKKYIYIHFLEFCQIHTTHHETTTTMNKQNISIPQTSYLLLLIPAPTPGNHGSNFWVDFNFFFHKTLPSSSHLLGSPGSELCEVWAVLDGMGWGVDRSANPVWKPQELSRGFLIPENEHHFQRRASLVPHMRAAALLLRLEW